MAEDPARSGDVAGAGTEDPLPRLRELCLALPETTERLSHGEPTWFVRGRKTFVTYADHHHDDRVAFWCAASPGVQEALVAADPAKYFRPPYVGHRGWVGVRVDVPVDWTEIAELVTDAYRVVAPRTLVATLDQQGDMPENGPPSQGPTGRQVL
ncbi:MmcQ/YjbR family DNA-binding protein [Prauserella oleivorans]|uniref:MmcQ/YjbR family DNA-binding protein n=1 Tax=Prauserella oleivorans TaxID=1478153 RepID=A0ABW5WAI7_9PSEU